MRIFEKQLGSLKQYYDLYDLVGYSNGTSREIHAERETIFYKFISSNLMRFDRIVRLSAIGDGQSRSARFPDKNCSDKVT